jgi:hypothetical protein
LEQLGTDHQRQNTAHHEHGESEQQIKGADVFVIGRKDPTPPTHWGTVVVIMSVVIAGHMAMGMNNCAHG